MKIIDESKVMGKPNESSNFKLLRIIIYKNIKKIANNQKLLIMTKKNPFYIRKEVSKDRDLEKFFETWTNIKKKKNWKRGIWNDWVQQYW